MEVIMPCGSFNSELSPYQNIHVGNDETGERIRVGRLKRSTLEGQVPEVEGNELITTLHNLVVPLRL